MSISRDELYSLVWSEPLTILAKRLGVSDSYLARVCNVLVVPRPGAGHWAKAAVGRAPPTKALPEARPDQRFEWKKGVPLPARIESNRETIRQRGSRSRHRVSLHRVLNGALALFQRSRKVQDDGYLRPYKRNLVDITTSADSLTRAIALANKFFLALEAEGCCVAIGHGQRSNAPAIEYREVPNKQPVYRTYWRPAHPTVSFIDDVAIGLTLVEMLEEVEMRYVGDGQYVRESEIKSRAPRYLGHSWTTKQEIASGRFCLIAYSAHPLVTWTTSWRETEQFRLEDEIEAIVSALKKSVAAERARIDEAVRTREAWELEYKARMERHAREEDQRNIAKARKESAVELDGLFEAWVRRRDLDTFFADLIRYANALPPKEAAELLDRVELARCLSGSADAVSHFATWRAPAARYRPKFEPTE